MMLKLELVLPVIMEVAFLVVLPYLDHDRANAGVWFSSARGKRIVVGRDYVEEELSVAGRRFRYRQPEGAFIDYTLRRDMTERTV